MTIKPRVTRLEIPGYLCGADDTVTAGSVALLLQEAAWRHAEELGFSFTREEGIIWVLSRLEVEERHPIPRAATVEVRTWPSTLARLYALREYEITTPAGETLVAGTSAWIILDVERRRPVRPETKIDYRFDGPSALGVTLDRVPSIAEERLASELADARWTSVREWDIDRNGHVNNARYVLWLTEGRTITPPHRALYLFLAESFAHDEWTVIRDGAVSEVWVRTDDGTPRCAARRIAIHP